MPKEVGSGNPRREVTGVPEAEVLLVDVALLDPVTVELDEFS
jgi:hypothetical protein